MDEVILEDLRQVTAMAWEHTREFAEYIGGRQSAEIQREIRRLERELTAVRKRGADLDAIFKKLYEDRVLGHLSVEQFQTLSGGYTEEQSGRVNEIPAKETAIQKLRETVSGTDGFIAKAKRYTDITELTPELLRLFIQKIVVHEKSTKWSKKTIQTIEIHYSGIGYIGGEIKRDKNPPAGNLSIIPVGELPQIVDTPVRETPKIRLLLRAGSTVRSRGKTLGGGAPKPPPKGFVSLDSRYFIVSALEKEFLLSKPAADRRR